MIKKIFHSRRGSATIDSMASLFVALVSIVIVIGIVANAFAVDNLRNYTTELRRTAECAGRVGEETSDRARQLTQETGLAPEITWSTTGNIQLGQEFTVTCKISRSIGLGGIGQWTIPMTVSRSGRSEVYWK